MANLWTNVSQWQYFIFALLFFFVGIHFSHSFLESIEWTILLEIFQFSLTRNGEETTFWKCQEWVPFGMKCLANSDYVARGKTFGDKLNWPTSVALPHQLDSRILITCSSLRNAVLRFLINFLVFFRNFTPE